MSIKHSYELQRRYIWLSRSFGGNLTSVIFWFPAVKFPTPCGNPTRFHLYNTLYSAKLPRFLFEALKITVHISKAKFLSRYHSSTTAKMCTRGTAISTSIDSKAPLHPFSTPPSSSVSITDIEKSSTGSGQYGEYFNPVLPASKEMRDIVGDTVSMFGGIAAVLLQIAQPSVGAGVFEYSSFTIRPIERGEFSCNRLFDSLSFFKCDVVASLQWLTKFRPSLSRLHLCTGLRDSRWTSLYHGCNASFSSKHQVLDLRRQRCRFATLGRINNLLVHGSILLV